MREPLGFVSVHWGRYSIMFRLCLELSLPATIRLRLSLLLSPPFSLSPLLFASCSLSCRIPIQFGSHAQRPQPNRRAQRSNMLYALCSAHASSRLLLRPEYESLNRLPYSPRAPSSLCMRSSQYSSGHPARHSNARRTHASLNSSRFLLSIRTYVFKRKDCEYRRTYVPYTRIVSLLPRFVLRSLITMRGL